VDWHADDEPEFGPMPVIASWSLGATRRFDLRRVDDHSIKVELELHHGDLVIMSGTTQELWRHRVPKTKKPVGERINLTFRLVTKP
jgi:alkylated DNA repair dioxygenase AlkB